MAFSLTSTSARDKKKMAKKAKKQQIKKPKKKKVQSEKYIAIATDLYCHGCKSFVRETIAELRGKQNETAVIDVMSYICRDN